MPVPGAGTPAEDNHFTVAENAAREAEARLSDNIAERRRLAAELDQACGRHEDSISAADIDAALQHEQTIHRLELEIRAAESEAPSLDAAFERARGALAQLYAGAAKAKLEAAQSELDRAALNFLEKLERAQQAHFELARLGAAGHIPPPPAAQALNGWFIQTAAHRAHLRHGRAA